MKQKLLIILLAITVAISLNACGSSSAGNALEKQTSGTGSSQNTAAANKSIKDEPAFEMYNKVTLGMTKDQLDSALGSTPKDSSSENGLKGTFTYMDKNNKYGVIVVYNDSNQAYSKTAVLGSHSKLLAPYCQKPISQKEADSIQNGMTNDDVVKILGGEGIECSVTGKANDWSKPGVIRYWGNKDGSFIQVIYLSSGKVMNALFGND